MTKLAKLANHSGSLRMLFPRFFLGLVIVSFLGTYTTTANALFGRYLPLNVNGSVSYGYNYSTSEFIESETTTLVGRINAAGYIWQPWFAGTSAAFNLGFNNTETSTSSYDSVSSSGAFSLDVFPRSRFPFSLVYSRSDSRNETFADSTQVLGDIHHKTTRLSLRQAYYARGGSLANLWFYTSSFESEGVSSDSEILGGSYKFRSSPHSLTATANHSLSKASDSDNEPTTKVVDVIHTYTPTTDLGVTNLASHVNTDSGIGESENTLSQVSSNFFWRPEHRAISIGGGVRVSKNETISNLGGSSEQKSLNTSLSLSYRLTRRMSLGAGVTLGSSDDQTTQTLTTNQSVNLSYASASSQVAGFNYGWQGSANASNSSSRSTTAGVETSDGIQTGGVSLGHSLNNSLALGKSSSLGLSFSQSGSMSSSSETKEISKSISHGAGITWNKRQRAGSIYGSLRGSDSRSFGEQQDSDFQQVNASVSTDVMLNRLSNLSGTLSYSASRQNIDSELLGASTTSLSRSVIGNIMYRHDRPFGIFNLNFYTHVVASKVIDSQDPEPLVDWESRFNYTLGLLDTSLTFRIIDSAGGIQTKILYFQATRSF